MYNRKVLRCRNSYALAKILMVKLTPLPKLPNTREQNKTRTHKKESTKN